MSFHPDRTPVLIMAAAVVVFGSLAWLSWETYVTQPTIQTAVDAPRQVKAGDPALLAVGDIADCDVAADEAVAALLTATPGTIATLGDTVYNNGSEQEFLKCFDPAWGSLKNRIRPAVGNHEYSTGEAEPYFRYFGPAAGQTGRGWYAYTLGTWQVIVLNSNCSEIGGCDLDSPQGTWLQEQLAAPTACSLVYYHHPRWSSGLHGSSSALKDFWNLFVEKKVDLVLSGHDHHYERFAPLGREGQVNTVSGLRQFIVGTGGKSLYPVKTILNGSEIRQNSTFGALQLQLHQDGYSWRFLPVDDETFQDRGSQRCH